MKRILAPLLLTAAPLCAQVPRAEPVAEDPALRRDPGNDFFIRAVNLHTAAKAATDLNTRQARYEQAADVFARYLADFPNHPNAEKAWWYLGDSHYQGGQIEEAKRCFHALLNRYGKGEWAGRAAYTLAADHYNKREFAFAAPLFERFANNAPTPTERPRGYYLAAECYRVLGRDREASANYRRIIEDPAGGLYEPQAKVALGHISVKGGKLQDALALYQEVANGSYPAKLRGEAALQGALTATKLNQPEVADKLLQLILLTEGMEGYHPEAQTALMANVFAKGNYKEVIQLYRRSSAKAEGETEAKRLMLAAQSHYRLKEWETARSLFREVESLAPAESDTAFNASYYRLLCTFQIEGRHMIDQVDAFLQIYRRSHPNHAYIHTALMMKADTLFTAGDAQAAAKVYADVDASVVSEKNRPSLLFHRGMSLAEAGDAQGAIRSLSEFLSKYPEDERRHQALAKRARAHVEAGDPTKAIADFDRLLAADVPAEFVAFSWLESARLRQSEGNIPDMVARYKGLLQNVPDLRNALEAEANYRIGWGLYKSDAATEAQAYLEKARELRPELYGKHAGQLLALSYYAAQDVGPLTAEINRAMEGGYDGDIPHQAIQWAGMQAYNAGEYADAAKFLERVSNPDEPRETAKGVWRFLAKARLKVRDFKGALTAANNVLAVEDNAAWKADGLHDKGRALFELNRPAEARKAVDEALELRPPPRTTTQLRILSGDLTLKSGDAAKAGAEYHAATFTEDEELKPLALWKVEQAYEKMGNVAEAAKYRAEREAAFPSWTPPKS